MARSQYGNCYSSFISAYDVLIVSSMLLYIDLHRRCCVLLFMVLLIFSFINSKNIILDQIEMFKLTSPSEMFQSSFDKGVSNSGIGVDQLAPLPKM